MKVKLLVFLDDGGVRVLRERECLDSLKAQEEAHDMFSMLLQKGIKEALPFPLEKLAIQICP